MTAIRAYEMDLYRRLADGLERGGSGPASLRDHRPVAVRAAHADGGDHDRGPRAAGDQRGAGRDGIATWDGDFYATGLIERLGLAEPGGVVRIGLTHYNTAAEIDRVVAALARIAEAAAVAMTRRG